MAKVLVRAEYGPPVDVWAVGVIMAEVVTKQPLFPGLSDADMLDKLSRILGPPDHSTWTEGVRRAFAAGYSTYSKQTTTLRDAVPGASSTALEFLSSLIVMNPTHRPTCAEALDSRFLLNSGVDDA
ncbi:hypothetical protein DIPPA_25357 [Diplonema papillatum]|nr:hypothetical protein DIPPA_25357 [Diplonema papillatum]